MQDSSDIGHSPEAAQPTDIDASTGFGASALLPDPRILWSIFRQRFWIFLLAVLFILGAVGTYIALAPKQYTAISSILIEPRANDPVSPTSATIEVLPNSDFIDTQIVVLGSTRMAASVVTMLQLENDPEFSVFGTDAPDLTPAEQRQARLVATAEKLQRAVVIRRAGRTAVIEVEATSRSATQAARIANAFGQAYLDSIRSAKQGSEVQASTQINSRLDQLRADTEKADAALQRYKIANGLMSAQGATMAEQESSVLNQQLAGARATLAERRGRLAAARQQLQKGGGGSDVTSALNSGTIGAFRTQEAESSRNLAQLRSRYGDRHPSIAQEEERLASIQRQIQLEIDRILTSLEGEVRVAESGVASLQASQAGSRARLAGNSTAQVGFLDLERRATAARAIYTAFLNKSIGAAAREGIEQPIASIASPALIPLVPSAPNVRLIGSLGALMALVFGFLAIALAEFIDGGIRTKRDVERRLGARYLGAIPEIGSTIPNVRQPEAPHDYIVTHPQSIFAEALRGVRAGITLRGRRRPRVIAVTSALPREGKTTTAVCLARTLALSGAKTVIIDCDVRHHSTSDTLLDGRDGLLLDLLAGETTLDAAMVKDIDTDLQIIGVTTDGADPRDMLATDALTKLIKTLRGQYEFVVIDTPPVIGLADARIVARQADTVLFLARWRKTSMRTAEAALDMLIAADAKVGGVALTLVDIRKYASTGHEDVYSYYGKFKGYYTN